MKTSGYSILIGFFAVTVFACSNPKKPSDCVKKAEKQNDIMFKNDVNREFLNDADFIVLAYNNGLTEVAIGNIAQKKRIGPRH